MILLTTRSPTNHRIVRGEKLEFSTEPLKKLVVEIIAFLSTLASIETDSG